MPPTKAPKTSVDQFAQHIDERVTSYAKPIAERLGPAPGMDRFSSREADRLWDTQDTSLNSQQLYEALQQGITPAGLQAVALFRMAPDLAQEVAGKPQPPDVAAAIAKLAEYPGRYVLTTGHSQEAEAQVKFVEDQHKRAAKRQAEPPLIEVPAPQPLVPPLVQQQPQPPSAPAIQAMPETPAMPLNGPDYGGYS